MLLTFKQIIETGLSSDEFYGYYKTHTQKECLFYFNIGRKVYDKLFKHFGLEKRSDKETRELLDKELLRSKCYRFIKDTNPDEFYEYYKTHSRDEVKKYYNIGNDAYYKFIKYYNLEYKSSSEKYEVFKRLNKERNGYENNFENPAVIQKIKDTCISKYGVSNYSQTEEFNKTFSKGYKYGDEYFDSSWELALWIYALDKGEEIEHIPFKIKYYIGDREHYYFPDFKYHDMIIDVKGAHLIKNGDIYCPFSEEENNKWKYKDKCMKDNNVKIWEYKDIKIYLDYCENKYLDKNWKDRFRSNDKINYIKQNKNIKEKDNGIKRS